MKYAYSIKTERVREPDFPYNGQKLSGTEDVLDFTHKLQDSDVEKMIVIYLNAQNVVIGVLPIIGTINQCAVFPREIMKHALLFSAYALILVHNHPSGLERPSEADMRLTNKINSIADDLGMKLHDHIIIAENKSFSFKEEGCL